MSIIRTGHVPFPLTDKTRGAILAWNPSDLANANRPLLSWWDARFGITEETGVSVMADLGVGGWDFVQATGVDQPALTGSDATALITYDAVSEFLEQPVNSGNFQDLTRFEWWGIVYVDQANTKETLFFNDEGGSTNNRLIMFITSSGDASVGSNDNSATIDLIETDTALSVGYHVVGFRCSGSEYSIYVDDLLVDTSVVVGDNTGLFLGDLTNKALIDLVSIASQQSGTPSYSPVRSRFSVCFGGTTDGALSTAAERTNIFNYANEAFNLGL